MVQNLGLNSNFLLPVVVKVCAGDSSFIDLLLASTQKGAEAEDGETTSWDVASLVWRLYEWHDREGYQLTLSFGSNVRFDSMKPTRNIIGKSLSLHPGTGNIVSCLQNVVRELETRELSNQGYRFSV